MRRFIAHIVKVDDVKEGDIITYIRDNELIYLMASHEDLDGCRSCFFSDNENFLCTGMSSLNCYGFKYKLYKGEIPNSESEYDKFMLVNVDAIKTSICSEDVCPYFIENCDKYSGKDSDLCIFKKVVDKHLELG